jgi:hypothetical protein
MDTVIALPADPRLPVGFMVTMPFVVPIADPDTMADPTGALAGGGCGRRPLPVTSCRQPEPEPSIINEKRGYGRMKEAAN